MLSQIHQKKENEIHINKITGGQENIAIDTKQDQNI